MRSNKKRDAEPYKLLTSYETFSAILVELTHLLVSEYSFKLHCVLHLHSLILGEE